MSWLWDWATRYRAESEATAQAMIHVGNVLRAHSHRNRTASDRIFAEAKRRTESQAAEAQAKAQAQAAAQTEALPAAVSATSSTATPPLPKQSQSPAKTTAAAASDRASERLRALRPPTPTPTPTTTTTTATASASAPASAPVPVPGSVGALYPALSASGASGASGAGSALVGVGAAGTRYYTDARVAPERVDLSPYPLDELEADTAFLARVNADALVRAVGTAILTTAAAYGLGRVAGVPRPWPLRMGTSVFTLVGAMAGMNAGQIDAARQFVSRRGHAIRGVDSASVGADGAVALGGSAPVRGSTVLSRQTRDLLAFHYPAHRALTGKGSDEAPRNQRSGERLPARSTELDAAADAADVSAAGSSSKRRF